MSEAITFDTVGGPEILRVRPWHPAEPKPHEVRLDIEYIGVNRPDLHFRSGIYPIKPTLPGSRLGIEAVGVIAAVGSEVTGHSVGDRVIAGPIAAQSEHGVYGDVAIVPAAEIIPAFDMLDPAHNAAAWIAYATAYSGLVHSGGLRSGQHVLITAASSNVGLAALQVANHVGAIPIAATRSMDKAQRLLDAGAKHVVVGTPGEISPTVRDLTGGRGVDLVFDAVGGPGFPDTAAAAADDGTVVIYGFFDDQPALLPQRWPMKIVGHIDFTMTRNPYRLASVRSFLGDGLASGALVPTIDRIFDGLHDVVEAHQHAASGRPFGKVLIGVNR